MATKKFVPFSKADQKFERSAKDKEGKKFGKEGSKKEEAADKKQAKGMPFKKGGAVKRGC